MAKNYIYCLVKERVDTSFLCMFSWDWEKIFKWQGLWLSYT